MGETERFREGEREREGERDIKREGGREREREKEGGREREREIKRDKEKGREIKREINREIMAIVVSVRSHCCEHPYLPCLLKFATILIRSVCLLDISLQSVSTVSVE